MKAIQAIAIESRIMSMCQTCGTVEWADVLVASTPGVTEELPLLIRCGCGVHYVRWGEKKGRF